MNLIELRCYIINKRENGVSYGKIGKEFGIPGSMVEYIETHENYKPSKQMIAKLKLDPDPSLVYTRTRRQKLDRIARDMGYACWSAYESAMIREYDK